MKLINFLQSLTEFEVVNTRIGDAVAQYIGEILKYNTVTLHYIYLLRI